MSLSDNHKERYRRNIILPEFGEKSQERLLCSKVLIVGAGGLGSPVAFYLAAAGVGTIGILDSDAVELGNLQRQILHTAKSIGTPKPESAKERLSALNPDIKVIPINERLLANNALSSIKDYDVIADCSDNFRTRFLLNDACVIAAKPLVSGAVKEYEGNLTTIIPRNGHCYRCIFETPPLAGTGIGPFGVLGAVPGVIGALQATEVIKVLLGLGDVMKNRLLIYYALGLGFREVSINRNPSCPACGDNPVIKELKEENYGF